MTPFKVEWDEHAVELLAALFLRINDPNSIWPAQHRADRRLERDPASGRELSEGLWQLVELPLKLFYEIRPNERLVIVTHVELA